MLSAKLAYVTVAVCDVETAAGSGQAIALMSGQPRCTVERLDHIGFIWPQSLEGPWAHLVPRDEL